ncbi:MAG: SCO family protein [Acidimicrobiales bacterium]
MSTSTDDPQTSSSARPVDRAAAFAAGPTKIPPRVIVIGLAVIVALALLGILGERFFSSVGLNPVAPKSPPKASPTTLPAGIPQLDAPLSAFMGIKAMTPLAAPGFSLVDQAGKAVSLARQHGKVVVLTFFDDSCSDICPVLEAEIAAAATDLGRSSDRVVFLTVNTDPMSPVVSATSPAVSDSALSNVTNWHLLGGSLAALDRVWRDDGVSVAVSPASRIVAHNDVMYFIGPAGRFAYEAVPYSNESQLGIFSLPAANITRWGHGIAEYAEKLLRSSP